MVRQKRGEGKRGAEQSGFFGLPVDPEGLVGWEGWRVNLFTNAKPSQYTNYTKYTGKTQAQLRVPPGTARPA